MNKYQKGKKLLLILKVYHGPCLLTDKPFKTNYLSKKYMLQWEVKLARTIQYSLL